MYVEEVWYILTVTHTSANTCCCTLYTLQVLFDFESKATELLPDAMQDLSFENEYEELEVSNHY
jgi:hypothetical protein